MRRYCRKQHFKILGTGCNPRFCRIVQYWCSCPATDLLVCNHFMKALQLQNMVLSNGPNLGGPTRVYIAFVIALHIFILEKLCSWCKVLHALSIYYISVVELSSTMLVCSQFKVLISNTHNYSKWRASLPTRIEVITQYQRTRISCYFLFSDFYRWGAQYVQAWVRTQGQFTPIIQLF